MSKQYRVKWEMDIEADTPEEAARAARDYQLDPEAIVGVFVVYEVAHDINGRGERSRPGVRVDLDALEGRYANPDDDCRYCVGGDEDAPCTCVNATCKHGAERER